MRVWLILLGLLALVLPVLAVEKTPVASVLAVASAERLPQAIVVLTDQQQKLDGCAHLADVQATQVVASYDVVLSPDGKRVMRGDWMVRYAVNACGEKGLRMVRFTSGRDGIQLRALVPGATLADVVLQADVMRSFELAARVAMPTCDKPLLVRDTKVLFHPKTPQTKWREAWIGRLCGRDVGQVVDFMPTAKGTVFKMSVPKKSAQ